MKHKYILFSGGFDSTLAFLKTIEENDNIKLMPMFFNYGQKSKEREAQAVSRLVPALRDRVKSEGKTIEIDDCITSEIPNAFQWSHSSIIEGRPETKDYGLENRNMILLSLVVSKIMADYRLEGSSGTIEIVTGFTNEYYDTKLSFVHLYNTLLEKIGQETGLKIRVITPLIPEDQKDTIKVGIKKLIRLAHSLNALELLESMTWSCYFPEGDNTCGHCPQCEKRKRIFGELHKKKKRGK